MRSLNVDVGWTEHTWQHALLKGLDQEMFYRFGNEKKPTDYDVFEDLLLEIGYSLEQSKRDAKSLGKKAPLLFRQKDDKERKKEKDQGGPSKDLKHDKDRKTDPSRKKEETKPRISEKSKGKVNWTDKSEATEGIPTTVVDEQGEGGLCLRCGYDNHSWAQCLRKEPVIESNAPQKTKSAGAKRKAESDKPDEEVSLSKKAKSAAVNVASQGYTPTTTNRGRIYE